jgi:hypothetical protein
MDSLLWKLHDHCFAGPGRYVVTVQPDKFRLIKSDDAIGIDFHVSRTGHFHLRPPAIPLCAIARIVEKQSWLDWIRDHIRFI